MIRIIMCEGETDMTLLGLYLKPMCGWEYLKKPKHPLDISKTNSGKNQKAESYGKNSEELIICCVGGKDNFEEFFKRNIIPMVFYSSEKEKNFRIALVTDADDRTVSEIEADVLSQLSPDVSLIQNNIWTTNTVHNSFDEEATIDFLLSIIPLKGSGALETVLMQSLAEMEDGEVIVTESGTFIDSLPDNKYIPSDRLKLKAKLGVVLSVIYPDKVFSQFDKQLEIVDWSSSSTLAECFEELMKI